MKIKFGIGDMLFDHFIFSKYSNMPWKNKKDRDLYFDKLEEISDVNKFNECLYRDSRNYIHKQMSDHILMIIISVLFMVYAFSGISQSIIFNLMYTNIAGVNLTMIITLFSYVISILTFIMAVIKLNKAKRQYNFIQNSELIEYISSK